MHSKGHIAAEGVKHRRPVGVKHRPLEPAEEEACWSPAVSGSLVAGQEELDSAAVAEEEEEAEFQKLFQMPDQQRPSIESWCFFVHSVSQTVAQ